MRFIRRHWYTLGLPIAIVAVMWASVSDLTRVQLILLLNFVVLLMHQFEEYAWPGGEPWIINEVMQPKGSRPDRYPLNQNNAFVINVPMAWSFYLLPVFFPEAVWIGLAPVLFGFSQMGPTVSPTIASSRRFTTLASRPSSSGTFPLESGISAKSRRAGGIGRSRSFIWQPSSRWG
jgi:hypothetical protein